MIVTKLKQRNEVLVDENRQLGEVIDALKQGKYNDSEGARLLFGEMNGKVQLEVDELRGEVDQLRQENNKLR